MNFSRYIVWGFHRHYHTHGHIHHGLFRALEHMFPGKAEWRDDVDGLPDDISNTFFITNHDVALQLPASESCFYLIHGGSDSAECKAKFWHLKGHMSWNVFIDFSYAYDEAAPFGRRPLNRPEAIWVAEDAPFYPSQNHMDFRWATDLLPHEIEANKAVARAWNPESRVINYVGTYWRVNEREIADFGRACRDGGIELRHYGAGQAEYNGSKVVSIEDNVKLVRESYFAPAIVGSHHLTEGYLPCRILKNVSYGMMGVTNSEKVQRVFGGKLIHDDDPYRLFFTARDLLASTPIEEVHALMDHVRDHHTYVQRLEAIFKAIDLVLAA